MTWHRFVDVFWTSTANLLALVMVAALVWSLWTLAGWVVRRRRLGRLQREFRENYERDKDKPLQVLEDPATFRPRIGSLEPRPDCNVPGCVLTLNHPGSCYMDHHLPGAPDHRLCSERTPDGAICARSYGHEGAHRTRHRDHSIHVGPTAKEIMRAQSQSQAHVDAEYGGQFRREVQARIITADPVADSDAAELRDWVRQVANPN